VRNGAIAQLGERLNGIQEVVGSIPIGSTNKISKLAIATYSSGSNLALGKERPPLGLRERNEGEVASLEGIKS
jgi:hypothetical protein